MATLYYYYKSCFCLYIFFFTFSVSIITIPYTCCAFTSPQNIETFYPFSSPPPVPVPVPVPSPNTSVLPPTSPPERGTPTAPPLRPVQRSSSSSSGTIVTAVVATAAGTFVAATLLLLAIRRYSKRRRKHDHVNPYSKDKAPQVTSDPFQGFHGNIKGLIVDEDGLDVVYWKKLRGQNNNDRDNGLCREVYKTDRMTQSRAVEEEQEDEAVRTRNGKRKPEAIQEVPLLLGKSSGSHHRVVPEKEIPNRSGLPRVGSNQSSGRGIVEIKAVKNPSSTSQSSEPPPQPTPLPSQPPPPRPPAKTTTAIANKQCPASPQPPPPNTSMAVPTKRGPAPPPPPLPQAASASKGQKPPSQTPPRGNIGKESEKKTGESSTGQAGAGQVKLKPLHWDKVNKNIEHSMVWDKIDIGSLRCNDDLMEALFGYVATNRKSPKRGESSSHPRSYNSSPSSQIVILDARKSQNAAIVLRSLAVSRQELLEALTDGHGLDTETLEKLKSIAPTKEEQSKMIDFYGDPTKLADAESFLYHLLKAVPMAFTRIHVMHFRSSYQGEIVNLRESLQVLELGCKELQSRGLFMKLLEAILKAGNRIHAGTLRGNAQAFKLTSLQKLSDVKSTDGKTTLLHFVVQEVVRSEGKRCVLNKNASFRRSGSSSSSNDSVNSLNLSKEEREKEYFKLGLPVVGGLSTEFTNVKKAAQIDYTTFFGACSSLDARAKETRLLLSECDVDGSGRLFLREMKSFLDGIEEELDVLWEEQKRVIELVKRTTDYYQDGASKDYQTNPFQIFVIVRDFLGMVDKACIEIARNQQRRASSPNSPASRTASPGQGSSSPSSPASRAARRFPVLPEHFNNRSSSSDSDNNI